MSAGDLPPDLRARIDTAVAEAVTVALEAGMKRRDAILGHAASIGRPMLSAHLAFMSDRTIADAIAALTASPLESEQRGDLGTNRHQG